MDGYENLGEYVTNYHFDHVARGTIGAPEGIDGSLPEYIEPGKEYEHQVTFQLPDSVLNADNVQVVAMIIDNRDNTIVNAERVNLIDTPMSLGGIRTNRCHQKERFYTIDGRATTSDRRGLLIVRNADGTVRKMVR